MQRLTANRWILEEVIDNQGSNAIPMEVLETLQYTITFDRENIFSLTIYCEIILGNYELDETVVSITRIRPTNVIDCVPPPVDPTTVNNFIEEFLDDGTLVIEFIEDQLSLRNIENDTALFRGCLAC